MDTFKVDKENFGQRLDVYLAKLVDLSRSQIKNLIDNEKVLVNNKNVKAGYKLSEDDVISLEYPKDSKPFAEKIDFNVIYEDEYIAVISKPQDLVVHIGAGNSSGTLVNGLLYKFKNQLSNLDPLRPGIVHRLDKNTSGLMIIAKNNQAHINLVDQFKNSQIKKYYLAIVHGKTPESGIIAEPIGRNPNDRKKMAVVYKNSKQAITKYKKLKEFQEYSLLNINLLTGRTHQIRVHMAYIGYPVLGDIIYGRKNSFKIGKQMLHSYKIIFNHPITNQKMEFKDEFPIRFKKFIDKIK